MAARARVRRLDLRSAKTKFQYLLTRYLSPSLSSCDLTGGFVFLSIRVFRLRFLYVCSKLIYGLPLELANFVLSLPHVSSFISSFFSSNRVVCRGQMIAVGNVAKGSSLSFLLYIREVSR